MVHKRLALLLVLSLALPAALVAAEQTLQPREITVGDLAVRLARQLGLDEAAKPAGAVAALTEAGVTVEGDLGRALNEGDLVAVLNQLGLHLTTSRPSRPVEGQQVERLLDLVVAGQEGRGGVSASDRGNSPPGGGFGRSKSKASPDG